MIDEIGLELPLKLLKNVIAQCFAFEQKVSPHFNVCIYCYTVVIIFILIR